MMSLGLLLLAQICIKNSTKNKGIEGRMKLRFRLVNAYCNQDQQKAIYMVKLPATFNVSQDESSESRITLLSQWLNLMSCAKQFLSQLISYCNLHISSWSPIRHIGHILADNDWWPINRCISSICLYFSNQQCPHVLLKHGMTQAVTIGAKLNETVSHWTMN